MSTFRNPVGPQSSRVYWRRRLVVGLGLLAVIIVIVLIVSRLVASGAPVPASTNTPAPSGSATGSPTPASTNPADAEACDPSKVELTAVTDSTSYDTGVTPVFSFSLKNNTSVACTLDAGSDLQEFIVTSGDERIWSSKDCQTDEVAATILLQPRVPFAGSSLPWDRTRSATDTCGTERSQVIAEGASYHLQVKIGDLTSINAVQFLLY
jgi:hypothetical protein